MSLVNFLRKEWRLGVCLAAALMVVTFLANYLYHFKKDAVEPIHCNIDEPRIDCLGNEPIYPLHAVFSATYIGFPDAFYVDVNGGFGAPPRFSISVLGLDVLFHLIIGFLLVPFIRTDRLGRIRMAVKTILVIIASGGLFVLFLLARSHFMEFTPGYVLTETAPVAEPHPVPPAVEGPLSYDLKGMDVKATVSRQEGSESLLHARSSWKESPCFAGRPSGYVDDLVDKIFAADVYTYQFRPAGPELYPDVTSQDLRVVLMENTPRYANDAEYLKDFCGGSDPVFTGLKNGWLVSVFQCYSEGCTTLRERIEPTFRYSAP